MTMGMGAIGSGFDASRFFVNAVQQNQQLEQLANSALSSGIDHYQNGRYAEAAHAFQQAVNLAPTSAYAPQAAEFLANAYLKQGRSDKAAEAYKTGIRLDPTSDTFHVKLGNLHYAEGQYGEARQAYANAVRLNPSAGNHFSLGQAYLSLEDYTRAANEFSVVQRLEPGAAGGYYGEGQALSKMARYDEAIASFTQALARDPGFDAAHLEMGFALADAGRMDEAEALMAVLEAKSPDMADTLSRYLYKVDSPRIQFASATSTFLYTLPMRTPLSMLGSYLTSPGASQTFTMEFQFDKQMDRESVENRFNWEIARASGGGPGENYNFGFPVPATEVALPAFPSYVYYDERNLKAVVTFTLTQNDAGDGTIDPSHVAFKFKGQDKYGNAMNPDYDQFTGFSRMA
jgi:TolA-binding protein